MKEIGLVEGPFCGGRVTVHGEPPRIIYTERQPSDFGWHYLKTVPDRLMEVEYSAKPFTHTQARYLYAPKSNRYLFDGICTTTAMSGATS